MTAAASIRTRSDGEACADRSRPQRQPGTLEPAGRGGVGRRRQDCWGRPGQVGRTCGDSARHNRNGYQRPSTTLAQAALRIGHARGPRGAARHYATSPSRRRRRHLNETQRSMVANKLANMPLGGAVYRSAQVPTDISQADAAKMLNVCPLVVDARSFSACGRHWLQSTS
jgi:hypothetical protein